MERCEHWFEPIKNQIVSNTSFTVSGIATNNNSAADRDFPPALTKELWFNVTAILYFQKLEMFQPHVCQRWSKVAISGEITVSNLLLTVRPVLKTIFDWLQAASTTLHERLCGSAKNSITVLVFILLTKWYFFAATTTRTFRFLNYKSLSFQPPI